MSYLSQCAAAVQEYNGTYRRCARESNERHDATIPLCHQHFRAAFRQIAQPIAEKLERERKRAARHHCNAEHAVLEYMEEGADFREFANTLTRESAQAYFMRCGEFVKIGASKHPLYRADSIRRVGGVVTPRGLDLSPLKLIATEPGGFERERELHVKFAHLRHTGEWFTETKELTDYIQELSA